MGYEFEGQVHHPGDFIYRSQMGRRVAKEGPTNVYYEQFATLDDDTPVEFLYTKDVIRKAATDASRKESHVYSGDTIYVISMMESLNKDDDDTSETVKRYIQDISFKPL